MSVTGRYQCTLLCRHPMGMVLKRHGIMTMREADGQLQGTMFPTFFWVEAPYSCGSCQDGNFSFTAHFGTPCQQFALEVSGTVADGRVSGIVKSPVGEYELTGVRVD